MKLENVEDVYPLSPTQQGLLFHTLKAPGTGVYLEQFTYTLHGALDTVAFRRAWEEVVQRHACLRTAFLSEGLETPLQVVRQRVELRWDEQDWRDRDPAARESALDALLATDRQRGFDPAQAPLMRHALFRLADDVYQFVWTHHHLLMDGWSLPLVLREVHAYYEAHRDGRALRLPTPRPYRDYIAWLKARDDGDAEAYWRDALRGVVEPTPLGIDIRSHTPANRASAPAAGGEYRARQVQLPEATTAELQAFARRQQLTTSSVLQGVWALLLSRYSGRDDVVFGVTAHGRPAELAGVESMIGLFVNMLPVRVRVPADARVGAWLAALQLEHAELRQHEHSALVDIQRWSEVPRGLPLFESTYSLGNFPVDRAVSDETPELEIRKGSSFERANYPLSLVAFPGRRLLLRVMYECARFAPGTVERILSHFEVALEAIVRDPDARLGELPLLGAAERQLVVEAWNDTGSELSPHESVVRRFAAQVARTPDAVAAEFRGEALRYCELHARAQQVAARLRALGAGPESVVALVAERSLELVVGLLGVLEAGAAFVPLDPEAPRARSDYVLDETGARVILTADGAWRDQPGSARHVVDLAALGTEVASEAPAAEPLPDQLAYVLYTSGSTGRPKGVMVSHRALSNHMTWMAAVFPLAATDRVLQKTPLTFDAAIWEFFAPLLAGATLVLAEPGGHRDSGYLVEALAEHEITTLQVVPTQLAQLLDEDELDTCDALARVFSGGEPLEHALVAQWSMRMEAELVNLYGPTEACIDATWWVCDAERGDVPIGRPVANVRAYVLDGDLQPVAIGVAGELVLGGAQLARGYASRPDGTAERFVPDPFAQSPGQRLYRTGDRARRAPDGAIELVGRLDHQVKLRGYRIELGEVDHALREHPGVRDAVTVVRDDLPGGPGLAAYAVAGEPAVRDLALERERSEQWREWFDAGFAGTVELDDPTFDTTGWTSSYTGEALPAAEMREWLDDTVACLVGLAPQRVLEIGCATGLLLFRLAPRCERYVATDASRAALDRVAHQLRGLERPPAGLTLLHRAPNELDEWEPGAFDVVVLNSAVQYFPSVAYLVDVLERVARLVTPGGAIFVGDVRNRALLPAFHASVALERAPSSLPRAELRAQVAHQLREDEQLALEPALFAALVGRVAGIASAELRPKRGRHPNELNRFRYDVVLRVGEPRAAGPRPDAIDWASTDLPQLASRLRDAGFERLRVTGVPDARVAADRAAVALLADERGPQTAGRLREVLAGRSAAGTTPDALRALAEPLGLAVDLHVSAAGPGHFDALFRRAADAGEPTPWTAAGDARAWTHFANDPLRQRAAQSLIPELRAFLHERLPEYMVPAHFAVLEALPLLSNGKLDRAALPAPEVGRRSEEHFAAPRTAREEAIAGIFGEVLRVERIGIRDDFFDLGGHSLLASQVIARLHERFEVQLPLRTLFDAPTVEALAERVEAFADPEGGTGEPKLVPVSRAQELPLSFAQERLWFLEQLEPGNTAYNFPSAVRLRGPLDVDALEYAFGEIVRRHEVLRTTFATVRGRAQQRIAEPARWRTRVIDLSGVAGSRRERLVRQLAQDEGARPFDLARGPLLRTELLRLGPEEHVLLLDVHHVASDAWSSGIFVDELSDWYRCMVSGQPREREALPVQYADYAHWQREWLTGAALEGQLAHWRQRLDGAPHAIGLPTDRPRPPLQTFRGAARAFALAPGTAAALSELGHAEGCTPFMTWLAAFAVLLHRYSGENDLVVGTPIAGRERPELQRLIGFFLNTLALRTDLSGEPSFRALLARVRGACLEAFAHQALPFEKLVDELHPERDLSRSPLFQVMFVLQHAPAQAPALHGLASERIGREVQTAKFDLTLTLTERAGGYAGSLEYNTDLYDAAAIDRMLAHFQHLVGSIAAAPDTAVGELAVFDEAERSLLLEAWNDTEASAPAEPVHRLFEAQVRRTPRAAAVVDGGEGLDFDGLNRRANRLAHHLRALGVGPEAVVGVALERSPDAAVAILAVLKAGAAYLPLDVAHPAGRLRFMLASAGAHWVVSAGAVAEALPASGARLVRLDADADAIAAQGDADPPWRTAPDQLAYAIYTSGSTGQPKGVMLSHRSLANLVLWQVERSGLGTGARTAQFASLGFDVHFQELFSSWCAGGAVVFVPDDVKRSPEETWRLLASERVERLFVPFAALRQLAETFDASACDALALREVVTAGEQLRISEAIAAMFDALPGCTLDNQYGPSESHVVSAYSAPDPVSRWPVLPAIGRPIANARLYVLDARLRPVPVGAAGELYIGGVSCARGYASRPDLTAERFVPDPFARSPGGRLYRTGDLARHLPDGNVAFLGRGDAQVKVRGYRVEPAEVEAALARHEQVREAIVVARDSAAAPGARRLVAYLLVADGAAAPNASELRALLAESLPEYMIPAAFVALDALPVTSSGKVDRRALPEPPPDRPELASEFVAPRTAVERALAEVWQSVLGIDAIGVHDNFFEVGGDSILSVQIAARAREAGHRLTTRELFQHPTVAELALVVDADIQATAGARPLPPEVQALAERLRRENPEIESVYPLSPTQHGMLFFRLLDASSEAYFNQVSRTHQGLDVAAFRRAWQRVIDRHPVFRTAIVHEQLEVPLQVVYRRVQLPWEEHDWRDVPTDEQVERLRALLDADRQRGFELSEAPLVRVQLIRAADDLHQVVWSWHHILVDGWSLDLFRKEVLDFYEAFCCGEELELPLPRPYADYIQWLARQDLAKAERYWRGALRGFTTPTVLGMDRSPGRPAWHGDEYSGARLDLDDATSSALREIARRAHVTLNTLMMGAWSVVLARYSGRDDVLFGLSVSGRPADLDGVEKMVGLFINTLPMRVRVDLDAPLPEWLRALQEQQSELREYEYSPLMEVQTWSDVRGGVPLFESIFVFENFPIDADYRQRAGAFARPERSLSTSRGITSYPLTLVVLPRGRISLQTTFHHRRFHRSLIGNLLANYRHLLEAIAADCETTAGALPWLTDAERTRLLVEWNDSGAAPAPEAGIHTRFEAQARSHPRRPAVVSGGHVLSYGEVDERANRLAHHLQALGVGPEVPVGICLERSAEMVVAALAVLKAGGAYVPLDPAQPPARLGALLADVGAPLLVVNDATESAVDGAACARVQLDAHADAIARRPEHAPHWEATPDHLAYVVFTSGSTGRPKGVMVTHRSLVAARAAWVAAYDLAPDDVHLQLANFAFDVFAGDWVRALTTGGRLVIVPFETLLDAPRLYALMRAEDVTCAEFVPAVLRNLTDHLRETGERLDFMRVLVAGSDRWTLAEHAQVGALCGDRTRLVNSYGVTEATIDSACWSGSELRLADEDPVPIGRPLTGVRLYVLDAALEPVATGVPAELFIGGAGVARGYAGEPARTAERFVPDPFAPEPGARLYRTGDLARYLPDGNLEFLGRIDDQVKLRGVRIELGEIEGVLAELPEVREAVVVVRESAPGEPQLVAYVVADSALQPSISELRAHLKAWLPAYMIPARYVFLDSLPLTPNGKVDRRSLPAPDSVGAAPDADFAPPSTPTELSLAEVWAAVLPVDRIGADDNFFDLGGHSLMAIRMIAQLHEKLGVRVGFRELMFQTLRQLAARVEEGRG